MKPTVSIRKALSDPKLLGNVLGGDSWRAWRVLLIAAMGEALTEDERAVFKQITGGREHEPLQPAEQLVGVIGRRGGKSRAIATLAAYLAALCDYSHVLAPGEKGVLLCIAPDSKQSTIALDYATAVFEQSPVLKQLIKNRTSDTLELNSGVTIEVRAASWRRLRGPTYIGILIDEAAYLYSEDTASSNPDTEILNAVAAGLSTTGGPMILISSPYAKRGELWEYYRKHYGAAGDPRILVAQGASRDFNPSLPQSVVDRALERDHAAASAEFLGIFRSDITSLFDFDRVMACVEHGCFERPPVKGIEYISATDSSGGSSDSFCCSVGHMEDDMLVVDAVREIKAPFDPESAVEEICQTMLPRYEVKSTMGDRYSAQWCSQAFEKRGIKYEAFERNTSQNYLEMLPRVNSGTIRLLDHKRSINQICSLERRTVRGAADKISHPPHCHDDLSCVIAGLCGIASSKRSSYISDLSWVGGPTSEPDKATGQKSLYSHPYFGLNIYG